MEYHNTRIHNHSDYSNIRGLDSTNSLEKLIMTSVQKGIEGVALTDHENMCGHVKFLKLAESLKKQGKISQNFKAILGNEIYLCRDGLNAKNYIKGKDGFWHFILIALDTIGFRQLSKLSSRAWNRSFYQFIERVPTYYSDIEEIIGNDRGHVVASTACLGSQFDKFILNKEYDKAKNFVAWCQSIFGKENFFIEFQPGLTNEQITFNKRALDFCKEHNLKFIITTDAHYPLKEDQEIHKAYLTSNESEREVDSFYESTYIMDNDEICEKMNYFSNEDLTQAFINSGLIYDRVEKYNIFQKQIVPRIPYRLLPQVESPALTNHHEIDQFITSPYEEDRYFISRIISKLTELKLDDEIHINRLCQELEELWIVSEKIEERLSVYFTTISKIIELGWTKADTLVGPWRGSIGALLFAYLLDIIQRDPLESPSELPYWRCISRGRAELADVDFDSQASKRETYKKVISDFFESFGGQAVSVATFGTTTSKSALQTAARGLGYDPELGTYLSSLIPVDRGFVRGLSQCYNGDESKDYKPIPLFVKEMSNYPDIWKVAQGIEGLIKNRGVHAAGIIITNCKTVEYAPTMKSPKGIICTQFELHDSEAVGLIKYDLLTVDALDRIRACMELLIKYGHMERQESLKATYDKYLSPNVLNYDNQEMWKLVGENKIGSLFQFDTNVGLQSARIIQPTSLKELAQANSLMRLIPEKGEATPTEEFAVYKKNPQKLKNDIWKLNAKESEKEILYNFMLSYGGVLDSQESVMQATMLPFTKYNIDEANKVRKVIAKKKLKEVEQLHSDYLNRGRELGTSEDILLFIWNQFKKSMGYSFSIIHTIAYSTIAVQELNLAYLYPKIYWDTACLIVDSNGMQDEDNESDESIQEISKMDNESEDDDIDDDDDNASIKKSSKSIKYDKISIAIGKMRSLGTIVSPPSVNYSNFTFTPNEEKNEIVYGLKGITRINTDKAHEIIINRPYKSFDDLNNRVKLSCLEAINLIKSGACDEFGDREELLMNYLHLIAGEKKKLTLQNLPGLIKYGLVPKEHSFEEKLYNFNKFLKKNKDGDCYFLDEYSLSFFQDNWDLSNLERIENGRGWINQKIWDKIYKKNIESIREFINNPTTLKKLNETLFNEVKEKYAKGNISTWEMDSIGFYHHKHELDYLPIKYLELVDFASLPEEPIVERSFENKDGHEIFIYTLNRIAGTVIGKDKLKNIVTLSTPTGIVKVKVYRSQFSKYDRQITSNNEDTGKKTIVERSWFTRGNILIITGIRRSDTFVPKSYKNSPYAPIELITDIDYNNKNFTVCQHRKEVI